MLDSPKEKIAELLTSSVRKDVLVDYDHFAQEALASAKKVGAMHAAGHRSSGVGYNLHLFLNDALAQAFGNASVPHPPLRGNAIVSGTTGVVTLMRIHKSQVQWDNAGRSKGKRKLCLRNEAVTGWFQPDLLREGSSVVEEPEFTASLVTQGSAASDRLEIYVVVTNDQMDLRNPLFQEPLSQFIQRYERMPGIVDKAHAKLRKAAKKADNSGGTEGPDTPETA
ncbi:hypothetical protein [Luteimonas sp. A482]